MGERPQVYSARLSIEAVQSEDWSRRLLTVLAAEITLVTLAERQPDKERSAPILKEIADRARRVVEAHGGSLHLSTDRDLIATFGSHRADPDDALRAMTAALELVHTIVHDASGRNLYASAKAGVATGRAVTAGRDDSADAAKDLIELAIATRTATQPGTVAIDRSTHDLIADEIDVTEVPGLDGFRVHSIKPRVTAHGAPLVGRALELATIRDAFDKAVTEKKTMVVTIVAEAGGGKSRLAHEAANHLVDAAIATARCSGEGRAQAWAPLAAIVEHLVGSDAEMTSAIARATETAPENERDLIRERLGALFDAAQESSLQETLWAARRLFEIVAADLPLVVVLDDLQWAESSILELIEYVATFSRNAPLLMLCLARPELLDHHPGWPGSGSTLTLRPLTQADMRSMLASTAAGLSDEQAARLLDLAGGNPLFVEEGAAALIESADRVLPSTVQGVVESRFENLPKREQSVARIASVVDDDFTVRTIAVISGQHEADVSEALDSLLARGIVTRKNGAMAFKHVVLQQAAYNRLPLGPRADLHETYAALLLEQSAERRDDVTVGRHLEAAHRTRVELDPTDRKLSELGERAGKLLAGAGRSSLAHGDVSAAASLLRRGLALLPPEHETRARLVIDLVHALTDAGRLNEANKALKEIGPNVNEATRARIRTEELVLYAFSPSGDWLQNARKELLDCLAVFERSGHPEDLCAAYRMLAEVEWESQRFASAGVLMQKALEQALKGNMAREAEDAISFLLSVEFWGPTPTDQAASRARDVLKQAIPGSVLEANAKHFLGGLLGMQGEFEEARSLMTQAVDRKEELGLRVNAAASSQELGMIEMMARDPVRAEAVLRHGYDVLLEMGETSFMATTAALLARALYGQGRMDDAYAMTEEAETAGHNEPLLLVEWGPCRAKILAERGRVEEAEALARKALELVDESDDVFYRGNAAMDAASILKGIGRSGEARDLLVQARGIYEAKGVKPLLKRVEVALDDLARSQ
jgi:tetratricopeptide (TPR) repeat protein